MHWRIAQYPTGGAPSRDYAVKAPSLEDAQRKLATAPDIPVWTLR